MAINSATGLDVHVRNPHPTYPCGSVANPDVLLYWYFPRVAGRSFFNRFERGEVADSLKSGPEPSAIFARRRPSLVILLAALHKALMPTDPRTVT